MDSDATTIVADKVSATWTYMKRKGFTLMVGTLAEVGQVIATELRDGKVSPKTDTVGFIETCRKLLSSGTIVKRVRSDAAGYQHKVIDYLMHHGLEFLIRAAMNEAIAKQIAALPEQAWQPLRLKDGQFIATRVGRPLHAQDVSQQPGIFPCRATHCQETGNHSRVVGKR